MARATAIPSPAARATAVASPPARASAPATRTTARPSPLAGAGSPGPAPSTGRSSPAPRPAAHPTPAPTLAPRQPSVAATPGRLAPTPIASSLASAVNRKLRSLIPNDDVTYKQTQLVGDIRAAIERAEAEYLGKLAPPPEVLRKALYVIYHARTASAPDSMTYVLRKLNIFGFAICTGWNVVAHPLGGGPPESGYVFGPCSGQLQPPPWATATLPAHPTPSPAPSR